MTDKLQTKELLSNTDIAPEDLQEILNNIEDNLSFWNVLYNDEVRSQEDPRQISLQQLSTVSDWLKMSSAPLYPSQDAKGVRGLIFRVFNLPIKIFGSPQIAFNQQLRNLLGELMIVLEQSNNKAAALETTIENLNIKVREFELENDGFRREIDSLTRQVAELQAALHHSLGTPGGEDRA